MIELKNIGLVFNPGTPNENRVFQNLNLKVEKNEFITIIGSNGAGKTTLFDILSGRHRPSSGEVHIDGENVTRLSEFRRAKKIGRIFQNPNAGTASNMTLEDNMMICSKKGFKGLRISLNRKRREFFREQLKQLDMGLEERLKDNVGLLSGGQRQALTLLMMVLSDPDLVLLDEHTAALDPRNAAIVMDLTNRFMEKQHLTTLMVTHNMQHAIDYGNRLLMMDSGEIVIDLKEDEKKGLTVEKLVEMFSKVRKKGFVSDRALLSGS